MRSRDVRAVGWPVSDARLDARALRRLRGAPSGDRDRTSATGTGTAHAASVTSPRTRAHAAEISARESCREASAAARIAFRIATAFDRPCAMITVPSHPTSGAPPYSE